MLRREIREPMSARVQLLDLMTETAVTALEEIDGFEFHLDEQPSPAAAPMAMIDFGHLCRDFSAIVDPERRLSILFPEATLRANRDDTQYVFRALFEETAHRARDTVSISVSDDPGRTNRLQASFRMTCNAGDRPTAAERHWLDSTLRSRRGEISIDADRARDDGLMTLIFTVFLPGHLVAAPDGSRAPREVNRGLSGRATG
ncbi:hypothetical protein [Ovoidimarina sediminis]|uniref:hypothetical protein n=1 Tax=Ovoidimarina sediminis TaxID=3079856 RepID=UPI00292E13E6|nr:hypothetical protein [Rhodophyticola sp. MJ-SS7]